MDSSQIIDIIVFILFHALLFYGWRRMIRFLKKGEKKYLNLGWAFIGIYCFILLLLFWTGSFESGTNFSKLEVPLYVIIGLLFFYFSVRIIQPVNKEMIRRIKKLFTDKDE